MVSVETAATTTTTASLPMSSQSVPRTTALRSTTTDTPLYREAWFVVVVCLAAVVSLIVVTLINVKCCCDSRQAYVRQRVPLDQSARTSPPSYRYHDNRVPDDDYARTFFDKRPVRCFLTRAAWFFFKLKVEVYQFARRLAAMGGHMLHGITQCHLPPGRGDIPALTPAEAGTGLSDPGRMQN